MGRSRLFVKLGASLVQVYGSVWRSSAHTREVLGAGTCARMLCKLEPEAEIEITLSTI